MAKINKDTNIECDCKPIHVEKMNKAEEVLRGIKHFDDMTNFFKNFSDATRLKIMSILREVESMCVCDIAVALNMTKSAISHQLKYLRKYNLVKCEKVGKIVFYSLADDHVKDILSKGMEHVLEDEK